MENITRLPNETDEELLYRLGNIREQKGWTWVELANIMNDLTNQEYTESKWRKQYTTFNKMFNANQTKLVSEEYLEEIVSQKQELQKEKYKFYDERAALNQKLRERARQEELNEILLRVLNGQDKPVKPLPFFKVDYQDKDMFVSLNDLHYGATFVNAWNEYSSEICENRLEQYATKILNLQNFLGCEKCIIWCNGDLISGSIHKTIQLTNKENVIEQIMGVSRIISNFITTLSAHFKEVIFCSVSGNHSRLDSKDNSLKNERADDLVEWYLEAKLSQLDNVKFNAYDKIDETMYRIKVRGKNYIGCHGDYDDSLLKILTLEKMLNEEAYAVLSGHLHHNKFEVNQNINCIMAGSIQGMDDYCIQKRIVGNPEQMIFTVTKNGIEGIYPIILK